MLLCLSSGARERYRQDIILALAMPEGSRLQFRYNEEWVDPTVREKIAGGQMSETAALICYIDQFDKTKTPELVPCRYASVVDAQMHGTTVIIGLALGEFAYAEHLASFTGEMRSLPGNSIPIVGENGQAVGHYCLEIGISPPRAMQLSSDVSVWEKIVTQLAQRPDFAGEKSFYMVEAIRDLSTGRKAITKGNCFELEPATSYECEICHFHPRRGADNTFLRLQALGSSVELTSNPVLVMDSRYDVKRVRFTTSRPNASKMSIVSVFRGEDARVKQSETFDFDLCLRVGGTWGYRLLVGLLLGILLAAPHISATYYDDELTRSSQLVLTVIFIVSGLVTGLVAAFGLKNAV